MKFQAKIDHLREVIPPVGGSGGGTVRMGGNRPDCAYFLLLGLCGAAFLLTIGGILTYIAFNPGSIDSHPHSALSHIPHFHHHSNINNKHHETTQHHHFYPHGQEAAASSSNHNNNKQDPHHQNTHHNHPVSKNESHHSPVQHENDHDKQHIVHTSESSKKNKTNEHHNSNTQTHNANNANAAAAEAAYEAKAKQSLALAIIGPLCLLMGIIVTLIVGILALKYDCDHEPEPNIAFLRLRSEMSLNFDADKNNYELLRPSSSIDQSGGQYSINPTGLPRC